MHSVVIHAPTPTRSPSKLSAAFPSLFPQASPHLTSLSFTVTHRHGFSWPQMSPVLVQIGRLLTSIPESYRRGLFPPKRANLGIILLHSRIDFFPGLRHTHARRWQRER